jgi:hypothetical protein
VILTLDTETATLQGDVYDLAYAIHNKKGKIVCTRNWLVAEIFTDAKKMMGAFYAKKMFSHYAPMLSDGKIKLVEWSEIVDTMRADIAQHKVDTVTAYNFGFDVRAMRNTNKLFSNTPVLQKPLKIIDIWQFSCEVLLNKKTYKKIAEAQGWKTPKGNFKTSAEMTYRFLTQDFNFIEQHTALHDVQIEVEILAKCFSRKKKIPYGLYNKSPWRIVNG